MAAPYRNRGAHRQEILRELGYDRARIAGLGACTIV